MIKHQVQNDRHAKHRLCICVYVCSIRGNHFFVVVVIFHVFVLFLQSFLFIHLFFWHWILLTTIYRSGRVKWLANEHCSGHGRLIEKIKKHNNKMHEHHRDEIATVRWPAQIRKHSTWWISLCATFNFICNVHAHVGQLICMRVCVMCVRRLQNSLIHIFFFFILLLDADSRLIYYTQAVLQ